MFIPILHRIDLNPIQLRYQRRLSCRVSVSSKAHVQSLRI